MRKFSILAAAAAMTAGTLSADVQIGKGLSVGGYVNTDLSTVDHSVNGKKAGFDVSTAEFDFAMDFGSGLTAQVDLEGSVGSDGSDDKEVAIEQARIDYAFGNSSLTIGKFDTFIGLEGMEAPDLYQISNSYTWDNEPLQHEGISYAYDAGMWNFATALVNSYNSDNGNDDNGVDNDKELTYLFHVGLTPVDSIAFNVNYALGNDDAGFNNDMNVLTADISYSNHGWTLGAELVQQDIEAANSDVNAYMLMANYMFTERFGATVRYSEQETDDGVDNSDDKNEYTLSASYAVTPNWNAVVEYRNDDIGPAASQDTIALRTFVTF